MTRILVNHRTGPFVIRKDDVEGDKLWVCGCGLTGTPPFCDGSHAAARMEPPGALVHYPGNDDANGPVPVDPALLGRAPGRDDAKEPEEGAA